MKKGFTLAELLVVMFIFVLLLEIVYAIFISSLMSQRRVLTEQEVLTQVNFVLEYMGRALRMAKKDDISISKQDVGKNCLSSGYKINYEVLAGGTQIKFRNYKNQCQSFFLSGTKIVEEKDGNTLDLTPPNLKVTLLKFDVSGQIQNDNLQPKVTILLEFQKPGKEAPTTIKVQTTVSQRDFDVQR